MPFKERNKLKTYICIVFTDFHHTKLYPFQNLSLEFILKVFLRFHKFQPRYSYKIYSYRKKKECNLFTQPYFFHSHSQRLCKFMRKKENVYIRKKVQLPKEGFRTTTWPSFHCLWTMDLTKLRRRRQREHLKSNRFYEKTTTLHVHHAFLYISWPSLIGKT